MNFSSAARVLQAIRNGDEVEWDRGENRVKINNAANCVPYFKPEEAKKVGIRINVNFGELMIILQHARLQFLSAFWSELAFFKVTLPLAPPDHAAEWGGLITTELNTPMRESLPYFELHNSRWCSVVSHGPGPQIWPKRGRWCPKFVPLEDIRIATDTTLDFENLDWFACRYAPTPYELVNDVWPENGVESKWDKRAIAQILKNYKNINYDYPANNYDWESSPEKLADWMRQDGGYFSSTAMPAIPLWKFYFKDETDEKNPGWFMRIVPETGAVRGSPPDDFLWPAKKYREEKTERPVAEKREHILHAQFGDLNAKAPFTWHGMRSLGMALMEPTFYMNLTRCKLLQHVLDNFNIWLRVTDPIDKARATVQEFGNLGVLKTGVSVIPQTERHQIDANLVEAVLANLKQLQVEASASYTQQSDTGSQKEQTAFETSVKLQQVNALMGGLLMKAFIYAKHEYKEICRRFCLPPEQTSDPDILKFRKRCQMAGIPPQWLDVDLWDIQPITPIGMGNPTLAEAKANELMQIRPLCDPTAQQEILHDVILVKTNDPRRAQRWAPLGKGKTATPAMKVAESDFNTLMRGIPVNVMEGISVAEQIQTLIGLMAGEIAMDEQEGNMASARDIKGLHTVEQHIGGLIQQLSQDPSPQAKQQVQAFKGQLMKLSNSIRGFEQRLQELQKKQQEQAQEQNGQAEKAKIAATLEKAKVDSALKARKARMDEALKQRNFQTEQRRKDAESFADMRRQDASAHAEIQRKNATAKADAIIKNRMKSLPE